MTQEYCKMPIFQFQKNRKCHIILPGEVITAKVAIFANLQISELNLNFPTQLVHVSVHDNYSDLDLRQGDRHGDQTEPEVGQGEIEDQQVPEQVSSFNQF